MALRLEAFAVAGAVAATDRAFCQVVDDGPNNRTILQAVVTNNVLTITFLETLVRAQL